MFRTLRKMLALAATAAVSGGPVHAQEVAETVAPPAPEEEAVAVAPPARFDPGQMPEAKPVTPPLGYRHGDLTASEAAALRRSLKLPLDALASASSSYDLTRRAVVAPLPDPHRPLLSVSPAAVSTANPFGDTRSTSFRTDPLKALGEMLGAVEGDSPRPGKTADQPAEDPFGGEATVELDGSAPAEAAEVTDDADAFGESGDPFGEEADGTAPTDEAEAPADGDDPFSF